MVITAERVVTAERALDLRREFVGVGHPVPVLDGQLVPYVNLDNAASTPALRSVVETVEEFLPFYSSVHRGTGYMSRLSTATYERARQHVSAFVGADPDRDVVIFGNNTTEVLNRLARSMRMPSGVVVLTTMLEHHSNDLPWRTRSRTVRVPAQRDGTLDEDRLDELLAEHAGRVGLLAVSGASNVTGLVQPVHRLAAKVHAVGGQILVDAAQLAAHRPIDMRPHDDPGHLDFVALSAHKMYAPFGIGVLVGGRDRFLGEPDHAGGGTVRAVTVDDVAWADLPDREEAGSPNVVGAVALAAAMRTLRALGLDRIAAHEAELARYARTRLANVPGVTLHGPVGCAAPRVGVIPFTVDGLAHGLVAAVLGYEHGVGVRHGCFCAHPYMHHLLQLDRWEVGRWLNLARGGEHRGAPGMVRISLGAYNDIADIDRAVRALEWLVAGEVQGTYREDCDGSFVPGGYAEPLLFDLGPPGFSD
ncbi:MAG: aminotransferase class V-fold PLP-dependent enzyme [Acidimicrobiales bacterium]